MGLDRFYEEIIAEHLAEHEQMLFLAGPRQVGKTTLSQTANSLTNQSLYLNWDHEKHRQILLAGEDAIMEAGNFNTASNKKPILLLDELHKYKDWKQFLKGFYDVHKKELQIIVTGSARLDIYKAGGDSLMGRYLLYRCHPFSVRELIDTRVSETLIHQPAPISQKKLKQLFEFGGFPEPFAKHNPRFLKQWQRLRQQQLVKEDIRDLNQVDNLAQLEVMVKILKKQAGQATNYSSIANAVKVSSNTVSRWINVLQSLYFCFTIKPWSKNVKRSLIKEPKVYLWDWSEVQDPGARYENFIACHLLKATHFWTDYGLGEFELHFLRDKEKRAVDFLVTRDGKPWFLVEAKLSNNQRISPALHYFQEQTQSPHAFQVVYNLPFHEKNCFDYKKPIIVSAQAFLSQLV